MSPFKIILVDDHPIVREGLKSLLKSEKDLHVAAEASDGEALMDLLKVHKPDVVILDLSMPGLDGLGALKLIRRDYPRIKVLILTMMKDYEHFKHCMSQGAAGFLLKDDAFEQLALAIRMALRDKVFVSPSISNLLSDHFVRSIEHAEEPSAHILTAREKEVLSAVARGLSNKQISASLKISIRTVESHRLNLCKKLGIRTIAGLVKYAMAKGLV